LTELRGMYFGCRGRRNGGGRGGHQEKAWATCLESGRREWCLDAKIKKGCRLWSWLRSGLGGEGGQRFKRGDFKIGRKGQNYKR